MLFNIWWKNISYSMMRVYPETCHVDILDKNQNTLKYFKSKFVIIIKDFIFFKFFITAYTKIIRDFQARHRTKKSQGIS